MHRDPADARDFHNALHFDWNCFGFLGDKKHQNWKNAFCVV